MNSIGRLVRFTKPVRSIMIALAIILSIGLGYAKPSQANASAQDPELEALARQYIADQQGIPVDQLSIVTSAASQLRLTGIALANFKVMAPDGRTLGVSFDTATRQVVDAAALAAQEQQARQATYGILEPALYDQVQRNAAELIPVAIWVAMEDPGTLARGENPNLNALAERARAAQAPVADAARGLGAVITQADLVPVIFAELNAGQINALAHHPNVIAIEKIPEDVGLHNDDSGTSDRYTSIWSTANGDLTKVAVHEDDGVDNVNPWLNNATHNVIYWNSGNPNIGSHATNVAGVIASTHNWRRGGAFNIDQILSANFQTFSPPNFGPNAVNSADWAIANGADTINMSWGTFCSGGNQNFFSRWVDYLVKATGRNIVVSAGNSTCPSGTPQYVGAPSLGWNTISVGAYWDNNTGSRTDDVLSSFTSWVNPTDPNSGFTYEKPDVTGMGGQVDGSGCHGTETTGVGGGVNDSTCGTSFAAPDTSALTALVVGKNLGGLRNNAEAVKAIVMAGATHNIVDGVNYTNCPGGDCKDGAGAIDAFQTIKNVVVPGNWRFPGLITPSSFDPSGNIDYPVTIGSGKLIRVAIAWDSTASCSNLGTPSQACASDVLNADLDLQLVNPSGTVVANSSSFQNSAEVIDYKTTVSGTWKIRVHNFRFDAGTNTFLGVAWNLATKDTLNNPLKGVVNFALNTTKTNQTTDMRPAFWDTYSGPAAGCAAFLNPETGPEKVYKVTTSSVGSITASLSNIVAVQSGVNSDIDVIILKKSGAALNQNSQVVACGDTTATASSQPAGTYYVVVDGWGGPNFNPIDNGSVAKFSLTVNFTQGAAAVPEEPLPVR